MRSCLLSPKYFGVVNRVLCQKLSENSNSNQTLRLVVIEFLNKLMKMNKEFTSLIRNEINMESFLKVNLFHGDTNSIGLIMEFYTNF
jgi:hypothetical protein